MLHAGGCFASLQSLCAASVTTVTKAPLVILHIQLMCRMQKVSDSRVKVRWELAFCNPHEMLERTQSKQPDRQLLECTNLNNGAKLHRHGASWTLYTNLNSWCQTCRSSSREAPHSKLQATCRWCHGARHQQTEACPKCNQTSTAYSRQMRASCSIVHSVEKRRMTKPET